MLHRELKKVMLYQSFLCSRGIVRLLTGLSGYSTMYHFSSIKAICQMLEAPKRMNGHAFRRFGAEVPLMRHN